MMTTNLGMFTFAFLYAVWLVACAHIGWYIGGKLPLPAEHR